MIETETINQNFFEKLKQKEENITDKEFNFLKNLKFKKTKGYRVKWVWDVFIDTLIRSEKFKDFPVFPFNFFDEINAEIIIKNFTKEISPYLPILKITNDQFRDIIGVKVSNSRVSILFEEFEGTRIQGHILKLKDKNPKLIHTIEFKNSPFLTVLHEFKSGIKYYVCKIEIAGFFFLQKLFRENYVTLFEKSFYQLSPIAQNITRHYAQFRANKNPKAYSLFSLLEISDLLHSLDNKILYTQKNRIEKSLDEMKSNKIIKNWKMKTKNLNKDIGNGKVYFDRSKNRVVNIKKFRMPIEKKFIYYLYPA